MASTSGQRAAPAGITGGRAQPERFWTEAAVGGRPARHRGSAGAGARPGGRQVPPFNPFLALRGEPTSCTARESGERRRAAPVPVAVQGKPPLHRHEPPKTTSRGTPGPLVPVSCPRTRDFPQFKLPRHRVFFPGGEDSGPTPAGSPLGAGRCPGGLRAPGSCTGRWLGPGPPPPRPAAGVRPCLAWEGRGGQQPPAGRGPDPVPLGVPTGRRGGSARPLPPSPRPTPTEHPQLLGRRQPRPPQPRRGYRGTGTEGHRRRAHPRLLGEAREPRGGAGAHRRGVGPGSVPLPSPPPPPPRGLCVSLAEPPVDVVVLFLERDVTPLA